MSSKNRSPENNASDRRSVDNDAVLVMGARGNVGGLIVDQLLGRGARVRASSRNAPADLPPGVDGVRADLNDVDSLTAAFDGIGSVFVYAVPGSGQTVLQAARQAGVEKIVVLSSGSVVHPSSAGNAITEEHRALEAEFASSEPPEVIAVRPLVLAGNALWWAHGVRSGTVRLYQPDARTAPIHETDIAAVAVAALSGDGGPVEAMLTGPAGLSQREQVELIGRLIGRTVAVQEESRSEALARFGRFMSAAEAEAVLMFLDDAAAGNSPTTDAVPAVLGRPARSFESWLRDHVDDFR